MVSLVNHVSTARADLLSLNSGTPSANSSTSANSMSSFSQELSSALNSLLGQSGNGAQVEITAEPGQGQNSGASQFLVTLTTPATDAAAAGPASSATTTPAASNTAPVTMFFSSAAAAAGASSAAAAPATSTTSTTSASSTTSTSSAASTGPAVVGQTEGMLVTPLQNELQSFEDSWSSLTPSEVAFQLANAAGTGGGAPTATVPGTNMTFGDLNQTQQIAYQYGTDFGTGGLSMQDLLAQSAGPDAAWNLSYNQIQASPVIQAAVDPAYSVVS
jgi:hypothetical protein